MKQNWWFGEETDGEEEEEDEYTYSPSADLASIQAWEGSWAFRDRDDEEETEESEEAE